MKKTLLLYTLLIVACSSTEKTINNDSIYLNSFNKNSASPLFVLDGVVVSSMDTLSPSSILEIHVLKNQKAIEKYGEKGEKGVIEIITKWQKETG